MEDLLRNMDVEFPPLLLRWFADLASEFNGCTPSIKALMKALKSLHVAVCVYDQDGVSLCRFYQVSQAFRC